MLAPLHMHRVEEMVGNTPLLRLSGVTADLPGHVTVALKAEWFNPGGSVKDRAALQIVKDALDTGELKPGKRLLDSSSGNTGIAYAMLGASMGFPVTLCLPANANQERKRTLLAFGTELVLTDPAEGSDGAILEAQRLAEAHPELYFYADQYGNDANWRAHYQTTGPELITQTEGRLTHLVVGLGTTGTCTGTGRYLREHLPSARIIACQPSSPFHGLEGWKHLDSAIVPPIYDPAVPHEQRTVVTEDAYELARQVARKDGVFLGISSAAALRCALSVAEECARSSNPSLVVAICPDGGSRYLSDELWEQP